MYNQKALNELKKLLLKEYPDYIEKIILFGSRVNDVEDKFSDYDILLILKQPYDWQLENQIYGITYDIDLKFDILTDIKIISKNELETLKGKQPFIQNAFKEGIEI